MLPSTISLDEFLNVKSRYPAVLTLVSNTKQPKKPKDPNSKSLEEIDHWKDEVKDLARAQEGKGQFSEPRLTFTTIKEIVVWKLKRGKFRPTILPLVEGNPKAELEKTVNEALAMPLTALESEDDDEALRQVSAMMKVLTKPKGIGPATATAILSAVFPDEIPMFSDECFRWMMMADAGSSKTAQKGWDRKIAYDVKEYAEYFKRVRSLCRRLTSENQRVDAGDVEKVGWVLGQEAALGLVDEKKPSITKDASQSVDTKQKGERKKFIAIKMENPESLDSKKPEAKVGLSKTTAKRKGTLAEISPPPLRRSKRKKEET